MYTYILFHILFYYGLSQDIEYKSLVLHSRTLSFMVAQMVKNLPAMQETWVCSLDWEDPREESLATHFSVLAWRVPQTEEPGGLRSMGSPKSQTRLTKHSTHTYLIACIC